MRVLLVWALCALFGFCLGQRPSTRIEIYVPQHRLFGYIKGKLVYKLKISTGTNRWYAPRDKDGKVIPGAKKRQAITERGDFQIWGKIPGFHKSPLGGMWWSLFFNGGQAIHGGNIRQPRSSHGCVHIKMSLAERFFKSYPRGTWVYVR